MKILIDGYNLLKQKHYGSYVEDKAKEQLSRQLGAYQKKRGHEIILIYDGGITPWPAQKLKSGITIVYAGYGKTADDYIKEYIAEHHKADLFLVSSDRELGHWASKHDIASIDSLPFFDIIMDSLAHGDKVKKKYSGVVKTTESENPLLDALMEQASVQMPDKDERSHTEGKRAPHAKTESKIERLLRKKIEKL